MSAVQAQAPVSHGFTQRLLSLWGLSDTKRLPPTTVLTPKDYSDDDFCSGKETKNPTSTRLDETNSARSRWRPKSHIMASHGWMNDPCAPGYDPHTSLYHVNFQWNPHGNGWGNMSWGSATSPNMIDWTICKTPSMEPTAEQDKFGVFTGALYHKNKSQGDKRLLASGSLTAFYTSAQDFPINHRLPYTRGSEKLAIATSNDSGKTWKRESQNIILEEPPVKYDVISWRDPFIERWESIDRLTNSVDNQTHQYGIISGGIRSQTPAVFIYRIERGSIPKWTFLSSLIDIGLNFCPSRWSGGDFGLNFEVTNFLTLKDSDDKSHDVLITSVEGRHEDPNGGELSKDHRQMWMSGPIERQDCDGPRMKFQAGGALDHGCFYAANGFWDPSTGQFVTFGWIFEEDLPEELVERQGWSGCLSIPRIVVLKTWKNVFGTTRSQVSELTCFNSTKDTDGTYTLQTVSLLPDPRLQRSRISELSPRQPLCDDLLTFTTAQSQLEIDLSFHMRAKAGHTAFDILHSPDGSEYTRIYFNSSTETVVIDRSQSTRQQGINVNPKQAPHTLFEFKNGETTIHEDLDFHVFFDTSVLEVFVNQRVAITTRVYPQEGTCYGIRIYTGDDQKELHGGMKEFGNTCENDALAELHRLNVWGLASNIGYTN